MEIRLKLQGSKNKEGIYEFKLCKVPGMHRIICSFLHDLGFSEESRVEIDQNIENLADDHIWTKSGKMRADIFAGSDIILLAVEPHNFDIIKIQEKYFTY